MEGAEGRIADALEEMCGDEVGVVERGGGSGLGGQASSAVVILRRESKTRKSLEPLDVRETLR